MNLETQLTQGVITAIQKLYNQTIDGSLVQFQKRIRRRYHAGGFPFCKNCPQIARTNCRTVSRRVEKSISDDPIVQHHQGISEPEHR